jgi:NAD+ synthase (glutamine-hydrolysing)
VTISYLCDNNFTNLFAMDINRFGFIRVAAASPKVKVADCDYNVSEIKSMINEAIRDHVQILCFPELCITSSTCADLFFQTTLQKKAISSLMNLTDFMRDKSSIIVIVGLPLQVKNSLYNVAAVISDEGVLGFVPKIFISNSDRFYGERWFVSGEMLTDFIVEIHGENIPIAPGGTIFQTPFGNFGVEICEDLWMPIPPSSYLAMQGADIIFNLSASSELVGKNNYLKSLILQQSGRCLSAYVYSSAGNGESTTDLVFSGACFIAENATMLAEGKRFSLENEMIVADIDIDALRNDRIKNSNYFIQKEKSCNEIICHVGPISVPFMYREINPHPFIPSKSFENENLSEVFNIQVHGLIKRLQHTGIRKVVIGVSGGLDSTLAFLVATKSFDILGIPRENIYGITMAGFGTTERTYKNAVMLIQSVGATLKEIPIVDSVKQHFKDIEFDEKDHSVTFENAQARERTQILMDYANMIGGLVVGTSTLSELALGWTTYNGDHMSMYSINAGVPKTLVKSLVRWIAETQMEGSIREILNNILATPFSPELLPADEKGEIIQKTEDVVGPYELHDFFLYRMFRYGDDPKRIVFLAGQAFKNKYSTEEIVKWLKVFYKRFFSQQFKRSCLPDGPKVGSVNLSPRSDWRMPSDAEVKIWLEQLEN